jgi:hypothetical protein
MGDLCKLIWCAVVGLLRSRAALQAEILVLRHQLNVLRRRAPKRLAFSVVDRMLFAGLYRLAPGVLDALKILRPETVIRWYRAGFRAYWRWKSRPRGGRPSISADICRLIREMSVANPLWGAPRILLPLVFRAIVAHERVGVRVGVRGSFHGYDAWRCPLTRRLRRRPLPASGERWSSRRAFGWRR